MNGKTVVITGASSGIGFGVAEAYVGRQIASGAADAHRLDVIVADLRMPVMDGLEISRRLRKDGWTLPDIL